MKRAWAAGFLGMWTACAPAGHGNPPAPEPAPSPGMIATLGFDQAVRMGERLREAVDGSRRRHAPRQPGDAGGIAQLTFDLGPGKFPVRVTVDRINGQVTSMEPVQGVTQPAQ